jgi:hypothetical protein
VEENYEAVEDGYRIIVMTAVQERDDEGNLVFDDEGNPVYPDGWTIPHEKPLDVVEMSWE